MSMKSTISAIYNSTHVMMLVFFIYIYTHIHIYTDLFKYVFNYYR